MANEEQNPPIVCQFHGTIHIADTEIPCAVSPDGERLLSENAVSTLLNVGRGGSHWVRSNSSLLPSYANASNLLPYIGVPAYEKLTHPIQYRVKGQSGRPNRGVVASLLHDLCDVYLSARRAGALTAAQDHIAERCEIVVQALASVGIDALVDESTGYSAVVR